MNTNAIEELTVNERLRINRIFQEAYSLNLCVVGLLEASGFSIIHQPYPRKGQIGNE